MHVTGPASSEEIAKQVINCHGPSGSNKEYVYNLAEAMREIAPHVEDEHLFTLEVALRRLEKSSWVKKRNLYFRAFR